MFRFSLYQGASLSALAALLASTPLAAQQAEQLPPIDVTASTVENTSAGPVSGYRALTSSSGTGTETPIERIPQSIQAIPRSLIDDQNAQNIAEATQNVSGVVATNPLQTPSYNSTFIRGMVAEQWLDGTNILYNPGNRDAMAHIERIEVIKGLSAAISGGGQGSAFGGVINVISKKPVDGKFAEFGMNVGSHRHILPYFDVNTPLDKDGYATLRMTGEYASSHSQIGVIDTRRYSLNPSLLLTNKQGTSLLLQGRISEWSAPEYQGLPATGTLTGSFRLNPNLFAGPSDLPRSYSRVQSISTKLDHQFDKIWSGSIDARFGKTAFAEYAQNFVGTDFAANSPALGSTWSLLNVKLYQQLTEAAVSAQSKATFDFGPSKNTWQFGVDYSRVTDKGYMLGDMNDLFLYSVDLTSPSFPAFVEPANIAANTFSDGNNSYINRGAQTQIQSTLWDRVHFLGGIRLANVGINSVSPTYGLSSSTDTTKALPRIGLGYDLISGVTAYASYSEGMRGVPYAFYTGTPKPEETQQKEVGFKLNFPFGVSGTIAAFEIERTGVPVTIGLVTSPIGETRSRGFEADLLWQPNTQYQFLASYAHVNSVITKDLSATFVAGNTMNIIPQDSGRLWANYKFDGGWKGWSIGAGLYASSGAFVDLANQFKTNPYMTLDAKVGYEKDHYAFSLTMKNLTDRHYFVPYNYYGGRVAVAPGRSVFLNMSYKFK